MVLQLQIFFRFLFEDSWPEALQLLCDREGEILRAKISMLRMAERASLVAQTVKNSSANAGDPGLTPGSERSPGERNGTPLQYSCLEFHGQRSLVGYSPWSCKEPDMTE